MNNFPTFSGDNLGGSQNFQFVDVNDVYSIPDAIDKVISSPIVLNDGVSLSDGYSSLNELDYEEVPKVVDAGTYFQKKISGFYPKVTPDALALFTDMKNRRFIVIVKDNNGYFRLLGTLKEPLFFTFNNKTKKEPSARNGFDFSFEIDYPEESPFYII